MRHAVTSFKNMPGIFSGAWQNRQSHDNLAGEDQTLPAFLFL
jgi:hypothetical protein